MKRKSLHLSDAASSDIAEQADWFEERSGSTLAGRWEVAVTAAFIRIVKHPFSGAPCQFTSDQLQGIRRMPIHKFPKHLVFYQIENDEVLILRVVHGARDLESLF